MEDQYYNVEYNKDEYTVPRNEQNTIGIVGFILALVSFGFCGVFSIVSIILCSIGLKNSKNYNDKGKGLCIAGLILSIIDLVFGIAMVVAFLLSATYTSINSNEVWNNEINSTVIDYYHGDY